MELIDAKELARLLGVKPATVHTWRRQGRIPAICPTLRTIRFELEAVLKVLPKREARSAAKVTVDER